MILYAVDELDTTMVLAKSIYHANGKLLLGAGYRITPAIKRKLKERGYSHVYIMEEGTEDVTPEDVISDEIKHQAKAKLADKIAEIEKQKKFQNLSGGRAKKLLEEGYLKEVDITYDLRKVVHEILKDISAVGAKMLNTVMVKTKDTYFLDHALNVTVLSILIGRQYRFDNNELVSLALGSFLHDVGKVVIGQLSDAEKSSKDMYSEHPTFGYLLLSNNPEMSPMERQIVNQHHEQQDGGGFPIGLTGQNLPPTKNVVRDRKGQIYRLAEICCVTNAFDNLVYNPHEKKQKMPGEAIRTIVESAGTKFNSDVVQTLLKVVPHYPVGTRVRIADIVDPSLIGYTGVVAKINEKNMNRPVIILVRNKFGKKIKPMVIDTANLNKIELSLLV